MKVCASEARTHLFDLNTSPRWKDAMLNLEENDTWAQTSDLHSGSAWIPTSNLAGKWDKPSLWDT